MVGEATHLPNITFFNPTYDFPHFNFNTSKYRKRIIYLDRSSIRIHPWLHLLRGEDETLFPCLENTYTLHPFENDQIFGWEKKITKAYASEIKNQVLHIPPNTAANVLRGKNNIAIKTKHNLDGGKWTIHTYTRQNGRKDNVVPRKMPERIDTRNNYRVATEGAYGGLILEWCDDDDCCMLKVIEVLDLWGSAGSLVMVVMVWMEEIDGYGGLVIVNEIRG
ncbi:hypothetical protein QL285_052000 [Trifolium repens]|nr:hypothetical protein QL285_052000 [Trifolium repens]